MSPDDPRHGTTRGHAAGCRCDGCREARNRDERRRRKTRQLYGTTRRAPAIGTQRRIRALMALGWTSRHIADHCGWQTAEAVSEILKDRNWVNAPTAAKIAAAYDNLSMRLGPSPQTRGRAARKGWPPPLAWDDDRIDDPDYEPHGWRYVPADRADQLADLDERQAGISEVCDALGIRRDSVERWCERNGMRDMYVRFMERETPYVERRNQWSREAS